MKPYLRLLLVLALTVSLCACAASRPGESAFRHDPVLLSDLSGAHAALAQETDPQSTDFPYTPVTFPSDEGNLVEETGGTEWALASSGDLAADFGVVSQEPWPTLTEEESAGGLVGLYNHVRISFAGDGHPDADQSRYIVPEFTLDSEAAEACNREIREICDPIVERAIASAAVSGEVEAEIDYFTGRGHGAVSLCVCINGKSSQYLVYTLDTQTGERLDNARIAAFYGISEEEYMDVLKTAFRLQQAKHTGDREDRIYHGLLEKTCARENLEEATLFIGPHGELMVMGKMYTDSGEGYRWLTFRVEAE